MAAHSGQQYVKAGDLVDVSLDFIMANDATTTLAIDVFQKELLGERVFDPKKIVIIMDHYTPSSSKEAADTHNKMRAFAKAQSISNVYDCAGVCHQLMLEKHVKPGQLIIGADSHTCTYGALGALATGMGSTDIAVGWLDGKVWMRVPETIKVIVSGLFPKGVYAKDLILKIIGDLTAEGATYKALCFEGETVEAMNVSERATLCNMGIEAGAKFAYIKPNKAVLEYMHTTGRTDFTLYEHDANAVFESILTYDVSQLEPQIAYPHCLDNVTGVNEYKDMVLDALFLGACTNGRYEDLEIAASILKGKKVAENVRLLVTPASNDIYLKALRSGLIEIFMESGAVISTPGCSACF